MSCCQRRRKSCQIVKTWKSQSGKREKDGRTKRSENAMLITRLSQHIREQPGNHWATRSHTIRISQFHHDGFFDACPQSFYPFSFTLLESRILQTGLNRLLPTMRPDTKQDCSLAFTEQNHLMGRRSRKSEFQDSIHSAVPFQPRKLQAHRVPWKPIRSSSPKRLGLVSSPSPVDAVAWGALHIWGVQQARIYPAQRLAGPHAVIGLAQSSSMYNLCLRAGIRTQRPRQASLVGQF